MALLKAEAVCKTFGGVVALQDVDINIEEGQITALIGPNGSGKTTFINVVTNYYKPTRGKVFFKGERIDTLPTHATAGRGIMRTFQVVRAFKHMSVLENVMCGGYNWTKSGVIESILLRSRINKEEAMLRELAMETLKFVGLEQVTASAAGALPLGHQRMMELARALLARPKLLLLDEPVSGLSNEEREMTQQKLVDVRDKGIAILLVEHEMKTVMKLADRIIVLNFGKKLAEGDPEAIRNNPEVIESYLGRRI